MAFRMRQGFTLIELLVVIAIIGLLSSIVLASLSTARSRAQDAKRQGDLRALSTAIEHYFIQNGNLPRTSGWCTYISNTANNWGPDFQADIRPYIASIPADPQYKGVSGDYWYHNQTDASGKFTVCAAATQGNGTTYSGSGCSGWTSSYNYCISMQ